MQINSKLNEKYRTIKNNKQIAHVVKTFIYELDITSKVTVTWTTVKFEQEDY